MKKRDELIGETTPLDDTLFPMQVWVNTKGEPIELICGEDSYPFYLSEARELHRYLGRAISLVEARQQPSRI